MDIEKLKQLNKPEDILEEYHVKLNLYAIPPETLERLMTLILGIAGEQILIKQQMEGLPAWREIRELLLPVLAKIEHLLTKEITEITEMVENSSEQQVSELKEVRRHIGIKTSELARTLKEDIREELSKSRSLILQGFEKSPARLAQRLIWMGVGIGTSMIFFLLLSLLKVF